MEDRRGTPTNGRPGDPPQEIAFYYPGATYTPGEWIKTMLLFFDGIALLAIDARVDPAPLTDWPEAALLRERKLLRVLDPETLVDDAIATRLRTLLTDAATWEAFDTVGRAKEFYYGPRVYSTLNGPEPSIEMMDLRNALFKHIGAGAPVREHGLAPLVPVHARLWAPVLSVVAQILRAGGERLGLDLQPVTDRPATLGALRQLLSLPGMPSSGRVVACELDQVAPNLAPMPLDEVLRFRAEHGQRYRAYARDLRRCVPEFGMLGAEESSHAFAKRREDLAEAAHELRRLARTWWRRPLPTCGLGLVGAAWTARQADTSPLKAVAEAIGTPYDSQAIGAHGYLLTEQPSLSA